MIIQTWGDPSDLKKQENKQMKTKIKNLVLVIAIFNLLPLNMVAKVKLPAIFSSNMVLQQKSEAAIWGWANPKSEVNRIYLLEWGKLFNPNR